MGDVKIYIISDSHGSKKKLTALLNENKYDYVFYLGDGIRDIEDFNDTNIKKVAGNCDFFSNEAGTQFVNINKLKIMLTHGHMFKSKFTSALLLEYAKQNFCDIVCSGHTHKQKVEKQDGILFINPGAFKNGEYAVLSIDSDGQTNVKCFKN